MTRLAERFRALARSRPWTVRVVGVMATILLAGDLWLLAKRVGYAQEISRLREGMSAVERARLDAALASDSNRLQVMIELARRQARGDVGLHLSVAVDSGMLYLEQEGATLRAVRVEVGSDAWMRTGPRDSVRITAPRGTRTVEEFLGDSGIVLSGGTLIYARGTADTTVGTKPGSVRLAAADLRVLRPNLRPGQRVYFY